MAKRSGLCLYRATLKGSRCMLVALLLLTASRADAQYARRSLDDPATGEKYHIEFSAGFWSPGANISIASESLGILGNTIDLKRDLGLTDGRFGELHAVLRPAKKHKFRFQYIPIKYSKDQQTVQLDIDPNDTCRGFIFNGQCYPVGIPVRWQLDWRAYRFAYEYDFIYRNRGFGGIILETKYTDVGADITALTNQPITEFAHAQGPVPAIGGIARVYVVPNISITGEVSGIKVPKIQNKYQAHYADVDIYGTLNVVNNAGIQLGYRSFDVGYLIKEDSGNFVLRGFYLGAAFRF